MRSARFILACAALSVLAACGTDPIAPAAPEAPRLEIMPTGGITPPDGATPDMVPSQCTGILTPVINPDGSVTYQCLLDPNRQHGSGG